MIINDNDDNPMCFAQTPALWKVQTEDCPASEVSAGLLKYFKHISSPKRKKIGP